MKNSFNYVLICFIQDQQTAIILSARCNHLECVKLLLDAGADVNAEDVVRELLDNIMRIMNHFHLG